MFASFDAHGLAHAILTYVTAGSGLGFNRAVLFVPDGHETELTAALAIGPATSEEAHATWARLASEHRTLVELLQKAGSRDAKSGLSKLVEGLSIPLTPELATRNPLTEAYYTGQVHKIVEARILDGLSPRLREVFCGTEVVCVPLLAKDRAIGLVIADNAFNREPIDEERIRFLELLALLAGLALDNARMYTQVEMQAQELRSALDELKATQDRLLHSERLATVGAVVARVSHEIRNPLATIGGFARTLGDHPNQAARINRVASIIVQEVEKLEVLLKEMLDFTSPRPPAFQRTDLNDVVATFVEVHRDELSAHGVELDVSLARDAPPVSADSTQLQRAFLNVWRNAVQAMETNRDGRPRRLCVRAESCGDGVRITFVDSGPGIAADLQPQIFTPFFTTKRHGSGLGLAVVRKIINDHAGTIAVRSSQDAGTTVEIVLPTWRSS